MTDAFKRRKAEAYGSLEAVRSRLRSAYLDQAIAIRWLTATSEPAHLTASRLGIKCTVEHLRVQEVLFRTILTQSSTSNDTGLEAAIL